MIKHLIDQWIKKVIIKGLKISKKKKNAVKPYTEI